MNSLETKIMRYVSDSRASCLLSTWCKMRTCECEDRVDFYTVSIIAITVIFSP